MSTTLARAEHWPVSPAEYHADNECISHSRLEDFIEDPALFEGRWITGKYPPKESDGFDFGDLVHDAILQGGTQCVIVEIPEDVLTKNGAKYGNAWKDFAAEHHGKYLLKPKEIPPIREAVDAVWRHPKARALLTYHGGENEFPIRWTDEETGILCRAMLDRLTAGPIVDLKTTASTKPSKFARDAYSFGYHRQGAFYVDAAEALTDEQKPFCIVAVRNQPPYSVETFVPDGEFIALGMDQNREALRLFAECQASGRWLRPDWGNFITIKAPKWRD